MKQIEGGVTAAKGFKATGLEVGIKAGHTGKKDMAMVYSEVPCKAAGTFTSNVVKAAPVKYDMDIVKNSPYVQAVVVNSGVANACTGEEGMKNCRLLADETARVLNIPDNSVIIGSTGVIGAQLPMDKMIKGVGSLAKQLGNTPEDATLAAEAIMTTDTVSKQIAYELEIGGKTVTVGGMCKGSGMIHPNMCTMLAFVTTDVNISKEMLTEIVKEDVKDTFNMISVDGDTSTNDTMIVMANGLAGNPEITEKNEDYEKFAKALLAINTFLAKKMAGDGEGATALFEVKVTGADTKENAIILSKSVVTSSLVKCAICGHDANWGRILCALGYSGVQFDPEKVDIYFESRAGKLKIVENSVSTGYSEEIATKILSEDEVTALIDMKMGDACATAWGCDLTHEYVNINADYRS
ncbi:MAG: bifunctional ornithine acetyltransferase/N-acetylglutamate synthase [Lachnospiraceae bacterium]|nr:bifunctional ornithine acetyltransferase/N-acetylglutamate synthase [Lachnospiraceae bacterium]